jgi:hypothetical protein
MNPAITQFDIIQSKLATTTIKKKYLMLIYEITILNIALINSGISVKYLISRNYYMISR